MCTIKGNRFRSWPLPPPSILTIPGWPCRAALCCRLLPPLFRPSPLLPWGQWFRELQRRAAHLVGFRVQGQEEVLGQDASVDEEGALFQASKRDQTVPSEVAIPLAVERKSPQLKCCRAVEARARARAGVTLGLMATAD